ncbi:hypothetical protein FKM82_025185 [Ascaphus truei]
MFSIHNYIYLQLTLHPQGPAAISSSIVLSRLKLNVAERTSHIPLPNQVPWFPFPITANNTTILPVSDAPCLGVTFDASPHIYAVAKSCHFLIGYTAKIRPFLWSTKTVMHTPVLSRIGYC